MLYLTYVRHCYTIAPTSDILTPTSDIVKGFIVTQTTKKLDVRLPADMRDALDSLATQRSSESKSTVKAADILREAIAYYLESKAIDVSPEVNRGGNRRTA